MKMMNTTATLMGQKGETELSHIRLLDNQVKGPSITTALGESRSTIQYRCRCLTAKFMTLDLRISCPKFCRAIDFPRLKFMKTRITIALGKAGSCQPLNRRTSAGPSSTCSTSHRDQFKYYDRNKIQTTDPQVLYDFWLSQTKLIEALRNDNKNLRKALRRHTQGIVADSLLSKLDEGMALERALQAKSQDVAYTLALYREDKLRQQQAVYRIKVRKEYSEQLVQQQPRPNSAATIVQRLYGSELAPQTQTIKKRDLVMQLVKAKQQSDPTAELVGAKQLARFVKQLPSGVQANFYQHSQSQILQIIESQMVRASAQLVALHKRKMGTLTLQPAKLFTFQNSVSQFLLQFRFSNEATLKHFLQQYSSQTKGLENKQKSPRARKQSEKVKGKFLDRVSVDLNKRKAERERKSKEQERIMEEMSKTTTGKGKVDFKRLQQMARSKRVAG